ncbi:hypothetical protein SU70_08470 [Thermosipho melanesiensis]|uniref:CRISPR-associated protein, MJ1666 family n=1 Tax=Thermosipho melanesiensis TaxID=46541 RepID=A0ABM6GHG2_9BACT|nr:hypothetical protein BW47_08835 [Thermosipho melanesiensis]OOC35479.1 hypothetical protein SU70_08470 [Thermosipho melanesiensis]
MILILKFLKLKGLGGIRLKVLFAIVGNLKTFREKKYRLNLEDQHSELICDSSLQLLSEYYNVDKTVIFLPDTLYTTCDINKIPSSYDELTKLLAEEYDKKIRKKLKINNFEIVIVPGIGTYKLGDGNLVFDGEIKDLYNFSLYKLYKLLLEKEFLNGEKVEFIFDISTGLNYHQSVISSVLNDLLKLLAYLKDTSLTIVNSEPITDLKEVLNVYIIDQKKIFPGIEIQKIKRHKILEVFPYLSNEEKRYYGLKFMKNLEQIILNKSGNKKIMEFFNMVLYFLNSLVYGLPLVLLYFNKKLKSNEIIEKSVKFFLEAIEIENNHVFRKLKFGEFFKYVVFAELFKEYFNNVIDDYNTDKIPFEILEETSEKVWKVKEPSSDLNVNAFISLSIKKELYEIKNSFLENIGEGQEVVFTKGPNKGTDTQKFNNASNKYDKTVNHDPRRNFLAHSGLSSGSFKLKKENDHLYISAIEDKIKKFLGILLKS